MENLRGALEERDYLKILEFLLKELFEKEIIDGAVFFSGENFEARILNDGLRISGKDLQNIEGIAKSFIERAKLEGKEIFEDDLVLKRGSQSSMWYRIKSIYVFPVIEENKILGILYVDRVRNENRFSEAEKLWLKFLGRIFQVYIKLSEDKKIIENLQKEIWIGSSKESEEVRAKLMKYRGLSPILLSGETETGKGLLAEILHKLSGCSGNFVVASLPSFPPSLFEAELFGSKKGAFTGSIEREGLISFAEGGTLFLDEISEIPLEVQAKLLRFLDTGFYKKLGEDKERKANYKVICATNRDLQGEVERGNFRRDLYFRISAYTIEIPPLRERVQDIEDIAVYYLKRNGYSISREALEILKKHKFSGNVRELQNMLNRAMVEWEGNIIDNLKIEKILMGGRTNKVDLLLNMMEKGGNFWDTVKKDFLNKDLNREEVKEIIKKALSRTRNGSFKELLKLFNLKEEEYHKFMAFLHKYKLIEKK